MDKFKKTFYRKDFTAVFSNTDGYFSLTGDINGSCGAVGHKIADIDPQFKLLEQMHLCHSETGEPTYALANGEYRFKEKNLGTLAEYWRTTPENLAKILLEQLKTENSPYQKYSKKMEEEDIQRVSKILKKMPEELKYTDLFPLKEKQLSNQEINEMLTSYPERWINSVVNEIKSMHSKKPIDAQSTLARSLQKAGILTSYNNYSVVFKKDPVVDVKILLSQVIPLISKEDPKVFHQYSDQPINFSKIIADCLQSERISVISSMADQMRPQWLAEAQQTIKIANELLEKTSKFSEKNEDDDVKKVALAKFVDCDINDITKDKHNEGVYIVHGKTYGILTPEETEAEYKEEVKQSLWSFNATFLANFMPLKSKEIQTIQENTSEDANESFVTLVGNKFDDLCNAARKTDGVGHMLNRYDGKEYSQEHAGEKFNLYLDFNPRTLEKKINHSLKM